MSHVPAWLMQVDRVSRVAVGQMELIHIIASPEYIEVPHAPEYCHRAVFWNDRLIPVVDLSVLTTGASAFYQHNSVAVALYWNQQGNELLYGGIQLTDMPVLEQVSNDQAVEAQLLSDQWRALSVSAFRSQAGEIVPIINIPTLFSTEIGAVLHS